MKNKIHLQQVLYTWKRVDLISVFFFFQCRGILAGPGFRFAMKGIIFREYGKLGVGLGKEKHFLSIS